MTDMINHPPHYNKGKIEPIEIIEDWDLPYHLGAVIKYIARYQHKGSPSEDLSKAAWYLNRFILGMSPGRPARDVTIPPVMP